MLRTGLLGNGLLGGGLLSGGLLRGGLLGGGLLSGGLLRGGLLGGGVASLMLFGSATGCSAPAPPSKPQPMGVLPTAVTSAEPLWVPFRVRAGKTLSAPSPSRLTELRQLTFDGHAGAAVFEPGGESILYETGAGEGRCGKLMRLDLQTGERTAMAPLDSAQASSTLASPALAAQAQLLALQSSKGETRCSPWGHKHGQQLRLDPAGITVLPYPQTGASAGRYQISGAGYNGSPTLTPDGRGLLFTSTRDGAPDLYAMTLGSEGVTRLTRTPGYDGWARLSPDGRQLVWHAGPLVSAVTATAAPSGDRAGADVDERKGSARSKQGRGKQGPSGKSQASRAGAKGATKSQASRSPAVKGQVKNAPASSGQAGKPASSAQVGVAGPVPPTGLNQHKPLKLVVMLGGPGAQSARVIANFGSFSAMPTFAADARHVLFASDRDHHGDGPRNYEIYRLDPDGPPTAAGHPRLERITFHDGYDGAPAVSPDGHHLLFTSSRNGKPGETNIFVARLDGR